MVSSLDDSVVLLFEIGFMIEEGHHWLQPFLVSVRGFKQICMLIFVRGKNHRDEMMPVVCAGDWHWQLLPSCCRPDR